MTRGRSTTALARAACGAAVLTAPVLIGTAPLTMWLAGLAAIAIVATGRRTPRTTAPRTSAIALERQLARCRRHGHGAELALISGTDPQALLPAVRATDAVLLTDAGELVLLTDAEDVDRRAVGQRLARHAGRAVDISWASFPQDALTVDDLLVTARTRAQEAITAPAAPVITHPTFARRRALADSRAC